MFPFAWSICLRMAADCVMSIWLPGVVSHFSATFRNSASIAARSVSADEAAPAVPGAGPQPAASSQNRSADDQADREKEHRPLGRMTSDFRGNRE